MGRVNRFANDAVLCSLRLWMSLDDQFRAMSDDELAKLVPHPVSLLSSTVDEMLASFEIDRRRREKEAPLKRERKLVKHREFLSKIEAGQFKQSNAEAISRLFSQATHIAFSDRGPYRFQYLPSWRVAADNCYVLRYLDGVLSSLTAGIPDGGLLDGIDCIQRRQIMSGMIFENLVIIRGQYHDDSELFVDEIRFLIQQVTYLPVK